MMITAASFLVLLLSLLTGALFLSRHNLHQRLYRNKSLVEVIDRKLPQTQCGDCGYPGCRPYAEAIVAGNSDINQCPPGGMETVNSIAAILGRQQASLDLGSAIEHSPVVAKIHEHLCIGCVKCIRACPVDAILGAAGQMHMVMPKVCTGCRLCVAPCPVDCIEIVPAETKIKKFVWDKPSQFPGVNTVEHPVT